MGIMCFQINLGCHSDVGFLTKAPGSPTSTLRCHALQGLSAATSAVSGGCLRREVGMMALLVAGESWASLIFLISLKKLHIIGDNSVRSGYDQKQFQVPDAKETWISENFSRVYNLSLMELWYYSVGSIRDCYSRKKSPKTLQALHFPAS